MADLVYSAICSLNGYVEDESGGFGWAAPDDEVHRFVNELERSIGIYLYGRRMYETMTFWETADASGPTAGAEYAGIWQAADKVVYSRTLEAVTTRRTRLERAFEAEQVRALKASSEGDISIGGAALGGQALATGLVDELQLLLVPAVVGGGKAALPDGLRADLELLDERRFGNGTVYLRYRVGS
jgi:dihydrofolate reductase